MTCMWTTHIFCFGSVTPLLFIKIVLTKITPFILGILIYAKKELLTLNEER